MPRARKHMQTPEVESPLPRLNNEGLLALNKLQLPIPSDRFGPRPSAVRLTPPPRAMRRSAFPMLTADGEAGGTMFRDVASSSA